MKPRWAVHPFLIAIFPPISLYAANFDSMPAATLIRPLAFLFATVALLYAGLWLLLRNKPKAALLASILFCAFWGWGFFEPFVRETLFPGTPIGRRYFFAAWCLPFLLLFWKSYRTRSDLNGATIILNVVASVLVAMPIGRVGLAQIVADAPESRDADLLAHQSPASGSKAQGDRPDIYYIILDGYGRADALAKAGFNLESGLADTLHTLDFFVASESEANYPQTKYSVSSSLNFDYLDNLAGGAPEDLPPAAVLRELIQENATVRFLKQQRYTVISCSSGYYLTENFGEDERIEPRVELSNFEVMLLNRTPLQSIHDSGSFSLSPYALHRRRIETCIESLPSIAKSPAPTFVIAHVVAPHHPFVFGPNGEELEYPDRQFDFRHEWWRDASPTKPGSLNPDYARGYSDQASHISKIVHTAVAQILENSQNPPVIIIQGDHGPNGFLDPQPEPTRYPILNAYHLPGGGAERLYESISPVNSFRLVLSYYFGVDLELLPDRH